MLKGPVLNLSVLHIPVFKGRPDRGRLRSSKRVLKYVRANDLMRSCNEWSFNVLSFMLPYIIIKFYEAPRWDSNLGPKAFSRLEFEIAPWTARPPRPVFTCWSYFSNLFYPPPKKIKKLIFLALDQYWHHRTIIDIIGPKITLSEQKMKDWEYKISCF